MSDADKIVHAIAGLQVTIALLPFVAAPLAFVVARMVQRYPARREE